MKTFEEKYTAWMDGLLPEDEVAAFEREMESRGGTPLDRGDWRKLSAMLRAQTPAPALANADFFNHGILQRIQEKPTTVRRESGWLPLPRLAWFGGFSLATALVLFLAVIPKKSETHSREALIAQVISARSADPTVTATAFESTGADGDGMAVVWLDGLDYVPQEKTINVP